MSRGRLRAGVAIAAVAAMVLTACGGKDSSSSSASDGGGAAAPAVTNQDAADTVKSLLAGDIDFPFPTDPVDPGTHRIAIIAAGLASPGPAVLAQNAEDAVTAIGWTADPAGDGKFTPTTQASLIEKAVLDKVDGIVLVAITPAAVDAAVSAAMNADIPIACALCGPDLPDGMIGIGNDHVAAGKAQAAYAASIAKPGDTVVVYQNTEFKASEQQMKAAAEEVKTLCPDCNVETPSLLLAESVAPNAPIFTALLNQYPAGKLSSVVGLGALSPFVDMVGSGTPAVAKADVLLSTPFYGWSAVDELARSISGADTWDANGMPVALIDKSTYSTYKAGDIFTLPDFDYQAKFKELWGK